MGLKEAISKRPYWNQGMIYGFIFGIIFLVIFSIIGISIGTCDKCDSNFGIWVHDHIFYDSIFVVTDIVGIAINGGLYSLGSGFNSIAAIITFPISWAILGTIYGIVKGRIKSKK